jgi:hypothetical protein
VDPYPDGKAVLKMQFENLFGQGSANFEQCPSLEEGGAPDSNEYFSS